MIITKMKDKKTFLITHLDFDFLVNTTLFPASVGISCCIITRYGFIRVFRISGPDTNGRVVGSSGKLGGMGIVKGAGW